VALSTQHSLQPGFLEAAAWARGQLEQLGYAAAQTDITVGSPLQRSHNIVADGTGNETDPRGLVLVTAHLDSINLAGGLLAPAPGLTTTAAGLPVCWRSPRSWPDIRQRTTCGWCFSGERRKDSSPAGSMWQR
jgi:hypothetical protein